MVAQLQIRIANIQDHLNQTVSAATAAPQLVVVSSPPAPVEERHPPTFQNIAYGLHRCEDAAMPFTSSMLKEAGACSDRFTRMEYVFDDRTQGEITHEMIDDNSGDDYMINWVKSALVYSMTTEEFHSEENDPEAYRNQQLVKQAITLFLHARSEDIEQLQPDKPVHSAPRYLEVMTHITFKPRVYVEGSGTRPPRPTHQKLMRQYYDIAEQRMIDWLHVATELVHHKFIYFPGAEDPEEDSGADGCNDETASINTDFSRVRFDIEILCPCGETDDMEVMLQFNNGREFDWDCPSCGHSHYIQLPALIWR